MSFEAVNKLNNCKKYKNIVFEGGGVKGIAYIGALRQLKKAKGLSNLVNFAGSSVGSIFATALAVGADVDYIEDKFRNTDLSKFLDDSPGFFGAFKDGYRIVYNYGYCQGKYLRNWIRKILDETMGNPDITFKELHEKTGKNLYITGTCINVKPNTRYFCAERTPNMKICDAVRGSTSIPGVFVPFITIDEETGKELYIEDGGVLENYPIDVFREFAEEDDIFNLDDTIGLYIYSSGEDSDKEINSIKDIVYINANMIIDVCSKKFVDEEEWERTCKIVVDGVSTIDFSVSEEQINYMLEQGKKAMKDFLIQD